MVLKSHRSFLQSDGFVRLNRLAVGQIIGADLAWTVGSSGGNHLQVVKQWSFHSVGCGYLQKWSSADGKRMRLHNCEGRGKRPRRQDKISQMGGDNCLERPVRVQRGVEECECRGCSKSTTDAVSCLRSLGIASRWARICGGKPGTSMCLKLPA